MVVQFALEASLNTYQRLYNRSFLRKSVNALRCLIGGYPATSGVIHVFEIFQRGEFFKGGCCKQSKNTPKFPVEATSANAISSIHTNYD